jgi:small subunit ribosomal protein S9
MNKTDLYPGQRKTCRAVATIVKGNGKIRINNIPAEVIQPELAKELILTPANIIGELRDRVDVSVHVNGGGFMGQAFASAVAISRALTGETKGSKEPREHPFTKSVRDEIKRKIIDFDRHLLAGDPRQTEAKKYGGPGARRRKQKSYR